MEDRKRDNCWLYGILQAIAAVFFMLVIVGILYMLSPLRRAEKLLAAGEGYLANKEYDDAIIQFQEAYETCPMSKSVVNKIYADLYKTMEDASNSNDAELRYDITEAVSMFQAGNPYLANIVEQAEEFAFGADDSYSDDEMDEEYDDETNEEYDDEINEEYGDEMDEEYEEEIDEEDEEEDVDMKEDEEGEEDGEDGEEDVDMEEDIDTGEDTEGDIV